MKKPELTKAELDRFFEDSDFVFDCPRSHRDVLISRYRGTALRKTVDGYEIRGWQKSMYRFGGLYREVPVFASLRLDHDGKVADITLDERCRGSQGRLCRFDVLQEHVEKDLIGADFRRFHRIFATAGSVRCLHLFEILNACSSFFTELEKRGLNEGLEQELINISPSPSGITAVNTHFCIDSEDTMGFELRHRSPVELNSHDLACSIDAEITLTFNGESALTEILRGTGFEAVYSELNRVFSAAQHIEKRFLGQNGRIKFTMYPGLTGLFLLSMSHEALGRLKTPIKALQIENILLFIQTGEGREPCVGFETRRPAK